MDTTMHHHLLTSLLHSSSSSLFIDFSLLLFFSLNRYHNMGNLLKVLTCTDLEQEPNFFLDFESEFSFLSNFSTSLPIWITWIFYHNITSSKTPKLKSFHHHLSFTLFLPAAKGIKSTTRAAALFHQPAFSMLECVQNINQGRGAAVPPPQI